MGGARYLVTGGAGFIGSNLVRALADAGEQVRALDDLSFGSWTALDGVRGSVERVTGDIRDPEVAAAACSGVEVVLHHAAIGSVPLSIERPALTDAVNTGGTVTLLEAARLAGVRRFVFAASSAAYGDAPALPKREDQTPAPLSPYAASKLAGEHYLSAYAALHRMETLSFRYFNVFGPGQRPNGAYAAAIPRFGWAAVTGGAATVFGDGHATRDFCFVDDVVSANLAAAGTARKLTGQVVNVATGRAVTINDVLDAVDAVRGVRVARTYVAARAGDIEHSRADVSAARELLDWAPRTDWRAGLARTLDWLAALAAREGSS